jgi:HEAT repeat protein
MLIGLLGDADGLCRFAAQDALIRVGLPAVEALNAALIDADEIVSQRLLTTAAAIGDERFARSAGELTAAQLPTTRALACAVLARIGDPGAGPMIVPLLADPETEVRLAAAAALARLSYWTAAPDVEPLLRDASWEVRKQASEALLAFGASGLILLRATALGEGLGAEMAVHALQLRSLTLESMSS